MRDKFKRLGKSIPKSDPKDVERIHFDIIKRIKEDYSKDLQREQSND